ncbi:MAG: COX15/CtaA family protein, partial [Polyangiaceae bacterium]|nr:COX15/CtaA family protein [Polyangiaceae bacterium]
MPSETTPSQRRFVLFIGVFLAYTIAVAVFGAYVRASMSGDGCGAHWPLCNGVVVPVAPSVQTLVELTHRVTSAACGLLAILGVFWSLRAYPRGHLARIGAGLTLFFVITEGLVGAGLVLLEYVAESQELARGYWMGAHLINTFVLLTSITVTGLFGAGVGAPRAPRESVGA